MDQNDKPVVSLSKGKREEVFNNVFAKEEGIIIEFDTPANNGKIRALRRVPAV